MARRQSRRVIPKKEGVIHVYALETYDKKDIEVSVNRKI